MPVEKALLDSVGATLAGVARRALSAHLASPARPWRDEVERVAGLPRLPVFVTLRTRDGWLRGCIGSLKPQEADLVLETFDNSASRRMVQDYCANGSIACLHAGLFADYGEVVWNERYRVPSDVGQDVCDYPLARNLVVLTAAVAAEIVLRFLATESRENWSITLRDFAIRPLEH